MNTQLILPLLLLPYLAMAAQSTDVEFTSSLTEAQARAADEDKLYFVHFTTTWCVPCQWMEANTFANDTLAAFVQDHYVAVKIDLDDRNAAQYKKQYKVTAIPSLLIFSAKGELLERHETSLSKDELLQALQKHLTLQPRKPAANSAVATRVAYYSPDKISRPALIPEEAKTPEKPTVTAMASATAISKTPQAAKVPSETAPTAHFAIQVGVFSDIANAERTRTQMAQRFKAPVSMLESRQDGKYLYKVMIGKFAQKEDADQFLSQLNAQSVKGYVKILDN
ncbi:MAG: SPOR domain-containing protein [Saprospiraceae bacterium]